jgi:hypothetical protein
MLAAQLGTPITHFTPQQGADLLAIKKTLGLPDARFDTVRLGECEPAYPEAPNSTAPQPAGAGNIDGKIDIEALVKSITQAVLKELAAR